jgi:hypothetical protein
MNDGGADGSIPCGTEVCVLPEVCCVKKVPLSAFCIPQEQFIPMGCEKAELPCLGPSDCPLGLACCLSTQGEWSVSCRPGALCPGDLVTTFLVCSENSDCPSGQINACQTLVQIDDMTDLKVCY